MTSELEDLELIAAVRHGSRDAFVLLVRKHQTKVRTLCRSVLLDASAAEDAAQDVFLKVYSHLGSFRGDALFSTWLYRIAVNHCRDLLRKDCRFKEKSWEALSSAQQDAISLAAHQILPDEALETRDVIVHLLSSLSTEHREVLCLRDIQDLSYEEIACSLDCSLDAVKGRLKRARAELLAKSRHFFTANGVQTKRERSGK